MCKILHIMKWRIFNFSPCFSSKFSLSIFLAKNICNNIRFCATPINFQGFFLEIYEYLDTPKYINTFFCLKKFLAQKLKKVFGHSSFKLLFWLTEQFVLANAYNLFTCKCSISNRNKDMFPLVWKGMIFFPNINHWS